jgi:hypothetical protein
MDPPNSSEILKKNKVHPLQIPPRFITQTNSEADKCNPITKETNNSNPASTINSARTDQPLLMSSPIMPKLTPPLPLPIPLEKSKEKKLSNVSATPKKNNYKPNKSTQKANLLIGTRVDCNGFPIIKGGKNHQIKFKDDLVKVIRIESYKRYNSENTNEATKDCLKCFCTIF